ncbi:cyclic AMP-responsive element-binding protein 1-like [Styela clava]
MESGTQSVITSNQQSVIQSPNQLNNGTDSARNTSSEDTQANSDTAKRQREILSRRPSYRKILSDLSSDSPSGINPAVKMEVLSENKSSEESESESDLSAISINTPTIAYQTSTGTVTIQQAPQTIQISTPSISDQSDMQTFSVANALSQGQAIVQQDGQLWVPGSHVVVQGSGGDLQAYQIRSTGGGQLSVVSGNSPSNTVQTPQQMAEEASRKRELRLMKNREAARDCRRKKKEYIKCLENRVQVLETQNKALIDELKTLKEMYCAKDM